MCVLSQRINEDAKITQFEANINVHTTYKIPNVKSAGCWPQWMRFSNKVCLKDKYKHHPRLQS